MSRMQGVLRNFGLVVVSVTLTFVLAAGADRMAGHFRRDAVLPGKAELLFPPDSVRSWKSNEFSYTVNVNSLGFRDREVERAKSDAFRVLLIGDSFVYGWGVAIENTWGRILEAMLRARGKNVEVLNLGKPGTSPKDYAEVAEKAIPMLRPDLVVVALLQGDDLGSCGPDESAKPVGRLMAFAERAFPNFVRMSREAHAAASGAAISQPLKESAEYNQKWQAGVAAEMLTKMSPEAKARYDAIDPEVRQAFVAGLFNPWRVEMATVNPGYYENILKLDTEMVRNATGYMAGYLARIRAAASLEGANVIAVSVPYGCYVNRFSLEGNRRCGFSGGEEMLSTEAMDSPLHEACSRAGISFFDDATKAFRARLDDVGLFYRFDGHLTPAGHALFAESMAPVVDEKAR